MPVNIGSDHVFVDSHRVYGAIRLPMLITGFELLGVFAESGEVELDEEMLSAQVENLAGDVLVLRKR